MVTIASIGESSVWRIFICPASARVLRVSLVRIANGDVVAAVILELLWVLCVIVYVSSGGIVLGCQQ